MIHEFIDFAEAFEQKNYVAVEKYLNISSNVMNVVDKITARL